MAQDPTSVLQALIQPMPKIIDSFLFFQELDLLEIRLRYLDPYVDVFVIVEAAQTFSGKPKDFVFARNRERFAKFLTKIHYHQIHDSHADFSSVVDWLGRQTSTTHQHVRSLLLGHDHYPRAEIQWVLDTYHRECIHLALAAIAAPQDIVLLSDLDEIPDRCVFDGIQSAGRPHVCRQHEFRYYLNLHKDSAWLGTIIGRYEQMCGLSLNLMRVDSKAPRRLISPEPIFPGGYHFTSCGGLEAIREKIRSWSHQEFNNSAVLSELERSIRTGQDIFFREVGTTLTKVEHTKAGLMDPELVRIIEQFPKLLFRGEIERVTIGVVGRIWHKCRGLAGKVQFKLVGLWRAFCTRARFK